MQTKSIVYIVDDNVGVRHSLTLLVRSAGMDVMACESAQEFLDHYDPTRPGCLVLDIRMPNMSGLDLQNKLSEVNPCLPIIVLTGYADVLLAVRAMKAGAFDLLEKPFNDQLLLDSINLAIDRSVALFFEQQDQINFQARIDRLSPIEIEVMDLLVQGGSTKEVAAVLDISSKTVDVHRGNILWKTETRSMLHLAKLMFKHSGNSSTLEIQAQSERRSFQISKFQGR